jgi:hypothetical protein
MTKNIGVADKTIRVLLALTFIYLYAYEYITGTLGLILSSLHYFSISAVLWAIAHYTPLWVSIPIRKSKLFPQFAFIPHDYGVALLFIPK